MRKAYNALMDLRQRRLAYETVLDRYSDRLPDAKRLSDIVHRKLAREALWAAARAYGPGRTEQTTLARRLLGAGANEEEQELTNSQLSPSTAGRR